MKSFFLSIIQNIFCFKRNILEEIIHIKFKPINYMYSEINCFNSDDLSCFINENNKEFKHFFIQGELTSTLNFLNINSIRASKTKTKFDSIYLFGKNVFLRENWTYKKCLEHIFRKNEETIFNLHYYKWNNKYEWDNGDGSHHFAVANFIATNEKLENCINCKIKTYEINLSIANKLLDEFEMFIFNSDISYNLNHIFGNDLKDSIHLIGGNTLILLDKEKAAKNKGYLNLLKILDDEYVLYFNDYLKNRI